MVSTAGLEPAPGFPTRPSNVRVYRFRHVDTGILNFQQKYIIINIFFVKDFADEGTRTPMSFLART